MHRLAKGLRELFRSRTFSWISRKHPVHLLNSRVLCKHCYLTGAAAGSIVCKKSALDAHAVTTRHLEAAAERGRQLTMLVRESRAPVARGARRMEACALAVGSLVAGGHGAAGLPPFAIGALLGKAQLTLQLRCAPRALLQRQRSHSSRRPLVLRLRLTRRGEGDEADDVDVVKDDE